MSASSSLLTSVITIAVVMVGTWVVSVVRRDASIVDIVWGSGFVVVAVVTHARDSAIGAADWFVTTMVALWGLRLSIHLGVRNHGAGEDYRYQAMRRHWGDRFWLISLVTVFALQGVMMWLVSLPVQLVRSGDGPGVGAWLIIGTIIAASGLVVETVADLQLRAFKASAENSGQIMDRGLWAWTRHPNYFGDSLFWWGIAVMVLGVPSARWGLIGALVMNVLLVRVSGVAMLERSLSRRKPEWEAYVARTPAFLPRPPRR